METLPCSAGELLRSYRARSGLTQHDLATRAGVSIRALRDLEHDRTRRPRARAVHALAEALALAPVEQEDLHRALAGAGRTGSGNQLYVAVLGPLSVRRGAQPVDVGPIKQRLLLGLLAIQPDQPVSTDEIVENLWPSRPPRTYQGLVHSYVARLRRSIEAQQHEGPARLITSGRGGYRLDLSYAELDVVRFEELARQARRASEGGDNPGASTSFASALGCWRGPVLADLGPVLPQHPAAVALARHRLDAALAYADLAIHSGQQEHAVAVLHDLAEAEALHEGLYARLMLALAGTGQQMAALRLFDQIRTRLAGDLGIAPGPELTAAHLRVLRQELPAAGGMAAARGATGPSHRAEPPVVPAQLPPDVADFTGRERELQRLHSLMRAVGPAATALPIVLLSGPPGVGKTALAVHWGHRVADSYVDGSLYVDLRGHSPDPPLSPTDALRHLLLGCGVAHADLPPEPEAAGALVRSVLAGRRVLIVLDNAASAAQIRPLLPGKGGCLVLVTSRDRLDGLVARQGARRIDLGALTGAESVALLTRVLGPERVRAEPNATAELAELCGGLPLALRIAAAHLTGVPASIAGYAAGLRTGDRVAQLAVAGDEASAGIEVAFDRSYAGLSTAARRLFRLAGLAPGADFTVEAVATLGDVSPGRAEAVLDQLAQAHLVQRLAPGRYRFHDLIRCYAVHRCQAEETTVVQDAALLRLVRAYASAATAAAGLLYPQLMRLHHPQAGDGTGQFIGHAEALAWFEAERANLVAAVRVAARYVWPEVAHLAYAARGYLEHRRHLDDLMEVARAGLAVTTATGDGRGEASAWMSLAIAHGSRAEFDLARQGFLTALRTAGRNGWPDIEAVAHNNLGVMYAQLGRLDEAARHYQGALAGYRRIGWDVGQGSCLTSLGNVCYRRGQLTDAVGYQTEAMELADRIGAVGVAAIARENLGRACLALGRIETALSHLAPALVRFRQVGNAPGEAAVLHLQAVAHLAAGDLARCERLAASALTIAQDTGDSAAEVDIHNTWGELGLRRGRPSAAADAYRRALHLAGVRGHRFGEVEALIGLAGAQAALGDPAAGLAAGRRALSRAQRQGYRVLEGRAGAALAHIYASCGRIGPAARHLERALGRRRETGDRACEARCLALLAQLRAGLADHPAHASRSSSTGKTVARVAARARPCRARTGTCQAVRMRVLRTPEERFADLPGFSYRPHYATVADGLRMAYVEAGPASGEPVLLLHGEPTWSFLYRRVIPVLADAGLRVLAPDLIGFGRSDKPAEVGDHSYAAHVEWVRSFAFDALDLAGVTVVGHDWGGLIGLRLATEYTDRVSRMVATNTGLPTGDQQMPDVWLRFREVVRSASVLDVPRLIRSGCRVAPPPEVLAAYDAPFPDETYKAAPRAMPDLVPTTPDDPASEPNRAAWRQLAAWDKPFLVAFSDSDPITSAMGPVMRGVVPGAQSVTIAGAGHFVQEDNGEELAATIVRFAAGRA